jgi:hypothetical protein
MIGITPDGREVEIVRIKRVPKDALVKRCAGCGREMRPSKARARVDFVSLYEPHDYGRRTDESPSAFAKRKCCSSQCEGVRRRSSLRDAQALQMRNDGALLKDIGAALGISTARAQQIVKRAKVKVRLAEDFDGIMSRAWLRS